MNPVQQNQPIGIFDSGIGGLTVANAVQQLLPHEKIIYFGDTAHLPYGDKSTTAIRSYAARIARFLMEKRCKLIIIACNTASSVAFNTIKKQVGSQVQVINVIDPVVRYVADKYEHGKVGVIGTKGTINSRIYPRRIEKANSRLKVTSMATPLLAPMIEEGFFNNYISKTIINSYLSKKNFEDIQAIILGCTHYPLIKKEVSEFYQRKVEIIDSAKVVAEYTRLRLQRKKLLSVKTTSPNHVFYVSDYTEAFEKSTRFFFKNKIHLRKIRIWDE